jgi:outer membrane receptor protein involved in Fe transport
MNSSTAAEAMVTARRTPARRVAGSCLAGLFLLLALGALPDARAQGLGTVTGVVVSTWDGTPLPGVVVTLRGTTLAAQTDATGRFQLSNVPSGDQVLRFSKSGYAAAVVTDVRVLTGQSTAVNGNLRPEFYAMEEFEITAEEFTEQTQQIMFERQQNVTFNDSLGSDFLSKVGAGDAAEALGKVTGTTIVDGKFAVIRGLADRYVSTTLNGAEVPSADPYRKAVQLDLFPSAMIESIVVSKTFTPDMPGGFTGGAVNVITKSFPEKFLFNFSLGVSYNTQGSLNDRFLTYQGGSTDWLGMDDGTRALPQIVRDTSIIQLAQTPSSFNAADAAFREQVNRSFGSLQMSPETTTSPLGHSFSISVGDTLTLFGRRLGYFAGLNYDRDFSFYENGVNQRFSGLQPDFDSGVFPPPLILIPELTLNDTRAVAEVSWGAIASLSYELFEGHELGFNFLFNQVGEDETRVQAGVYAPTTDSREFQTESLHWTERQLRVLQFRGGHQFPEALDAQLNWLASLSETSQDEPDLRFFTFFKGTAFGQPVYIVDDPLLIRPARYFRELAENNQNFKVDAEVPFNQWSDLVGKLKTGLYYSGSERAYDERVVGYYSHNGYQPFISNGDSSTFLTQSNLTAQPAGNGRFIFPRYVADLQNSFNYDGQSAISAAYGMFELPIFESLRFVAGARLERTDLEVSTFNASSRQTTASSIRQDDLLPAASLIYTLVTNMNLRLSYAETIARPTFREFSATDSFDFAGGDILSGNPNLVISAVKNYDIRWEWFRRAGEVFAASFFYKEIANPIEVAQTAFGPTRIQYINSPEATLWGIELEARTALDLLDDNLKNFSVGANFTYIQSEVLRSPDEQGNRDFFNVPGGITRPLYDQSPYIINADVTYESKSLGTIISVVYNVSGERLYFAGYTVPDVYEQPAPRLDLILSQKLSEHWKLKFSAKNLLNPEVRRIHDYADPNGEDYIYSSYTRGLEFGLSLSFDY